MIIGKNSWKYLVLYLVVLTIAVITGIFAYNSEIANPTACKIFGVLNIVMAALLIRNNFIKHSND